MSPPIRVLIADDHPVLRQGLRGLLAVQPEFEVVGEAADGAETIRQVRRLCPDIILLDLVMPGTDGLSAIARIRHLDPDAKILVLTSFAADEQIFPALEAGALGYVLKDTPPQDLIQAIRDVARGKPALHPEVALRMMDRTQVEADPPGLAETLTQREVDVLKEVARGRSNREIAADLGVSERTVTTHVSHILGKLNLENRIQAALYALRKGLVPLDEA